jgi:hypothetical protein
MCSLLPLLKLPVPVAAATNSDPWPHSSIMIWARNSLPSLWPSAQRLRHVSLFSGPMSSVHSLSTFPILLPMALLQRVACLWPNQLARNSSSYPRQICRRQILDPSPSFCPQRARPTLRLPTCIARCWPGRGRRPGYGWFEEPGTQAAAY